MQISNSSAASPLSASAPTSRRTPQPPPATVSAPTTPAVVDQAELTSERASIVSRETEASDPKRGHGKANGHHEKVKLSFEDRLGDAKIKLKFSERLKDGSTAKLTERVERRLDKFIEKADLDDATAEAVSALGTQFADALGKIGSAAETGHAVGSSDHASAITDAFGRLTDALGALFGSSGAPMPTPTEVRPAIEASRPATLAPLAEASAPTSATTVRADARIDVLA